MELRPFRSLRYSPRIVSERGLSALIAPPTAKLRQEDRRLSEAAPENISRIIRPPQDAGEPHASTGETLKQWLAEGILQKERRPGLWIYRQSFEEAGRTIVLDLLVGLLRLDESAPRVAWPEDTAATKAKEEHLALLRAMRADFELSLLLTRAPLAGPLSTTRCPDLSAFDSDGVRHDALRINDYAEHVELQGLVKNVETVLASGLDGYEAARQFSQDPEAAKLPGAKFKLCAILDEVFLKESKRSPVPYCGLFGFSLEDSVY